MQSFVRCECSRVVSIVFHDALGGDRCVSVMFGAIYARYFDAWRLKLFNLKEY